MTLFEKARAAGLDERQIEKSQMVFDTVHSRTMEIHEAMDRVILHAAMHDNPGKHIHIPRLGVGAHIPGATETVIA